MVPTAYSSNPILAGPTPRRVKVTFNSRLTRAAIYGGFLIVIAIASALGLLVVNIDRALLDHGKTAYAQVVSKSIKVKKNSTEWDLHYTYKVGKSNFRGEEAVKEPQYNATKIKSRLLVTYLPEAPGTNQAGRMTIHDLHSTMIGAAIAPAFFGLLFLLVIASKESYVRTQVRLLQNGIETQAVVGSKRTLGMGTWRSPVTYWITCNFYAGQLPTSKEFSVSQTLFEGVDTGWSLSVVYLPTRPQVNMLYIDITDVKITDVKITGQS